MFGKRTQSRDSGAGATGLQRLKDRGLNDRAASPQAIEPKIAHAATPRPAVIAPRPGQAGLAALTERLKPVARQRIAIAEAMTMTRGEIAHHMESLVEDALARDRVALDTLDRRNLVTLLINYVLDDSAEIMVAARSEPAQAPIVPKAKNGRGASRASIEDAKLRIQPILVDRIDAAAAKMARSDLAHQVGEIASEILDEEKIQLNQIERRDLVTMLLNDMLGLGPLEPLLADHTINDIMVNGPYQVFVERDGKLELSDVKFRDDAHVMNVATRIVTAIGRRIDESSPLVDARLADGSRVNIIIPPLAIDGPSISIRKFAKKGITLDVMERQENLSPEMATVLRVAARSKLNILISGGTGSGKTTLLNALSQMIDTNDRIVTIEDAAELQLQQPHVVRLETRPTNLEGNGEVTMRDLLKNSLRMRPDRIILGEVRGAEAIDMLHAMNTGHEGSLGTIHANRPREALTRLENMIGLAGINLPSRAIRTQIAEALDMIIQVSRMRDGTRRIVSIVEVVGTEGDIITTQELFAYKYEGENSDGSLRGRFETTELRPHFTEKASYFGLEMTLMEAMA